MSKVRQIEEAIRSLSREEIAGLLRWLRECDAEAWDREMEADARAGKLDALAEHRARRSKPI